VKKLFLLAGGLLLTGCVSKSAQPASLTVNCTTPNSVTGKSISNSATTLKPVNKKNTCILTNKTTGECILRLEAKGVGVPPCNGTCSTAQAMVMARRAAIVDAYKALAEKMYGIQVNGRDTVKNMILQNSQLRAYVYGLIRGAQIEEEDFKNGVYSVVLSVKLNPQEWNRYIENYPTVVNNY
jgi:hypothetical protein